MAERESGTVSTWAVAGLRVQSNRTLRRCREADGARWDVQVLFHSAADGLDRAPPGSDDPPPGWHRSPPGVSGWIRADGRQVRIGDPADPADDHGAQVRRVLPYSAALQGRVMLHAAAVAARDGIHAFVGASGAGKSTLAAELARQGAVVAADDLLLCRELRGRVLATLGRRRKGAFRPLAGVYFLERGADRGELRSEALSRKECFRRLLRHGFGELEVAEVWALQFDLFERIAARVPAFALAMPDDLDRLFEATGDLIRDYLDGPGPPPRTDS